MTIDEKTPEPQEYVWISYADRRPSSPGLYLVSNGNLIRAAIFLPATELWSLQDGGLIKDSWGLKYWCPMPPMQDEPPKKEEPHFTQELNGLVREADDINRQLHENAEASNKLRNDLIFLVARLSEIAEEQTRAHALEKQQEEKK